MSSQSPSSLHLLLMRHAKSSWQDASVADHDRPLAPRGLKDAPDMAARIARRGRTPELILSSSARRALQTARVLADVLSLSPDRLHVVADLYLASANEMLAVIRARTDRTLSLAVVGHNPGITDLVNDLLTDVRLDNLPTAGVVSMLSSASEWRDIGADNASLDYYDYPKSDSGKQPR
jgi:phosphohistidine phosphatase